MAHVTAGRERQSLCDFILPTAGKVPGAGDCFVESVITIVGGEVLHWGEGEGNVVKRVS